jgi:hypothetical protein
VSSTTPADIIVGVDTHKDIHVAVAISASGVYLATTTVKADTKGYGALESWTRSMGVVQAFGIEGTGSYGGADGSGAAHCRRSRSARSQRCWPVATGVPVRRMRCCRPMLPPW